MGNLQLSIYENLLAINIAVMRHSTFPFLCGAQKINHRYSTRRRIYFYKAHKRLPLHHTLVVHGQFLDILRIPKEVSTSRSCLVILFNINVSGRDGIPVMCVDLKQDTQEG